MLWRHYGIIFQYEVITKIRKIQNKTIVLRNNSQKWEEMNVWNPAQTRK